MVASHSDQTADSSFTVAELNANGATNAAIGIHEAHKGRTPIDLPWNMICEEDLLRHMADTLHLAASMGQLNAKALTQRALDLYLMEAAAEVSQGLVGEPIKCLKCGDTPGRRLTRWFVLCPDCKPSA